MRISSLILLALASPVLADDCNPQWADMTTTPAPARVAVLGDQSASHWEVQYGWDAFPRNMTNYMGSLTNSDIWQEGYPKLFYVKIAYPDWDATSDPLYSHLAYRNRMRVHWLAETNVYTVTDLARLPGPYTVGLGEHMFSFCDGFGRNVSILGGWVVMRGPTLDPNIEDMIEHNPVVGPLGGSGKSTDPFQFLIQVNGVGGPASLQVSGTDDAATTLSPTNWPLQQAFIVDGGGGTIVETTNQSMFFRVYRTDITLPPPGSYDPLTE